MLVHYFISFMILTIQFNRIHSDCSHINVCTCDKDVVVCDANDWNQIETNYSLPSVDNYYFLNFKEIPENAFQHLTFLSNHSITIHLVNITTISSNAFSASMSIPDTSILSISIEHKTNSSSIALQSNAFNHIKIERLHFFNINNFNGRPIFDTNCFGENLDVKELIFQRTGITGFSTVRQSPINVKYLIIRESPALTQLTSKSLPSFLSTVESLEISNTGLQLINPFTFQSQSLVLKELIIRDNMNLKKLSSNITDGILKTIEKFDFSNNPINSLDIYYVWSAFIYVKHLILKQQQIDFFLQGNMLKTLENLRTIDFSEGFIRKNNEDLINDHIPLMYHLVSFNISYTNFTEKMIIKLLARLTQSNNQTLTVSLLGHKFNDNNFCSYYTIFKKSLNLIQVELDELHECNCIIDLFYHDKNTSSLTSTSLRQPQCLLNTTRTRCDIAVQTTILKCPIDKPNPDGSETNNSNVDYVLIGTLVGLAVILMIVLGFGSIVVVRRRRRRETDRRMTAICMDEPIENPLAVIMEQRLHISH